MADVTECTNRMPNDPTGWNQICWWGTLTGAAADVVDACEQGVNLDPDNGNIRDSRGVNRALHGDSQGAIDDFRAYVAWAEAQMENIDNDAEAEEYAAAIARRKAWITALEAGEDPFDDATLEALRKE